MSVTDLETGRSLRRVERALRQRERILGPSEVVMKDKITESDKNLFGRPVRFEVDVCIPITDLKKDLAEIRRRLADCIAHLETDGTTHDRRFAVHRILSRVRAEMHFQKRQRAKPLPEVLLKQQE